MRKLVVFAAALCLASAALAEDPAQNPVVVLSPSVDPEQLKIALTQARRQVFEDGMALSEPTKSVFWNVYDGFEKEKKVLDGKRLATLQEYVSKKDQLTDEQAMRLVNDFANTAQEEIKLRVKYANELSKKIPGVLAARFYQIDSYITTAMTLDLLDNMKLLGTD